jgi:hypothetical protein
MFRVGPKWPVAPCSMSALLRLNRHRCHQQTLVEVQARCAWPPKEDIPGSLLANGPLQSGSGTQAESEVSSLHQPARPPPPDGALLVHHLAPKRCTAPPRCNVSFRELEAASRSMTACVSLLIAELATQIFSDVGLGQRINELNNLWRQRTSQRRGRSSFILVVSTGRRNTLS